MPHQEGRGVGPHRSHVPDDARRMDRTGGLGGMLRTSLVQKHNLQVGRDVNTEM